jgi:cytoskeletal protein CcmA (bactofilin family)
MAWSWSDRKKQAGGEWTGFLEQGVRFEGTLEAEGTFRVDSNVKGIIVSRDTLILGEHAFVEGEIDGNVVLIAGRFTGKIRAKARVEVQADAVVTGDVVTPCLMVDPGGVFDGECSLPPISEEVTPITIHVRSVPLATATTEVPS